MPFSVPSQVGETFDIGIETRDATTLNCKDRNGNVIALSQVGYVADPHQEQSESTELQRKSQLVQLGPTLMDREWDQWVQETQGSWASGLGQRIQFGGEADPAAYWDGLGIIWPETDWIPQQPFQPPAFSDVGQPSPGIPSYMGTVAGFVDGIGTGYAFSYALAGPTIALRFNASGGVAWSLNNPLGNANPILDMVVGHGNIWILGSDAANQLSLFYVRAGAGTALVATKLATISATSALARVGMAYGNVTNRQYVAVISTQNPVANYPQDTITIFDITNTNGTPVNNALTSLQIPAGWSCDQVGFLGDDLVISMNDGMNSEIAAWNIASQAFRTLAQLPGGSTAAFTPVAGGMFVLVNNHISGQKSLDLYILQGTALQHYGPLIPQLGSTIFPYVSASTKPIGFGPYAIWAVAVQSVAGGASTLLLYAYDLLRGRVFKMASLAGMDSTLPGLIDEATIAAFSSMQRTSPTTFNCQWGVAINVNTATGGAKNIQEFVIGVQKTPGSSGPLLQLPFDATSGLVDFTSAAPKNYRQVLARFTPLPNSAQASVTINAWLDQDPAALAAVPDFTVSLVGNAPGAAGTTKLSLPINKLGIKVVYEVITTGGVWTGAAWVDSPKIISVAVQAATGWVWHMFLALGRNVLTNSNNAGDYVWDHQGTSCDEVAAYNFLKNLWRLRGGECKITVPNGDSYLALLQMEDFKNFKPYSSNPVANLPPGYENVVEIRVREDI